MNQTIIELQNKGLIESQAEIKQLTSGTTDGRVYAVLENEIPSCILKYDQPRNIGIVARFLETYENIRLLPDVYYVDPDKRFFLYEYFEGTTHVNRGNKADWMKLLVEGLFNHYEKYDSQAPWGRVGGTPRHDWLEFNRISLEYAFENVGDLLPYEDYVQMKGLSNGLLSMNKRKSTFCMGIRAFITLCFVKTNLLV